ncbi:hypothetical protein K438DRAFT_1831050 [Mycena galopus ATCC 62051]|nr:hypothetical protein K438DRAFT_1831050 [Mycena galopus ATCC 62051]
MASFDHTVNPDQATFLGFGLEGVAYGIHVILFGIALSLLVRKTPKGASIKPIFSISCLLFCMSTIHYGINFNNVYVSTMVHPRPHIADETHLLVGADTMFILSDFFSQIVLIYRCYLVWNKNIWVIILPVLVAFAAAACGLSVIGLVLSTSPTAPQAPAAIVPFGDASFSMSLILNFCSSTLIVGRLWWLARKNDSGISGTSRSVRIVRQVMGVIVESGLLFLATQFVFVILFAIAHPAQALVEPMAVQIYAISPLLIVVRICMGQSYEQTVIPTIESSDSTGTSLRFVSFTRKPVKSNTTATSGTVGDVSGLDMELGPFKNESSKGTVVDNAV